MFPPPIASILYNFILSVKYIFTSAFVAHVGVSLSPGWRVRRFASIFPILPICACDPPDWPWSYLDMAGLETREPATLSSNRVCITGSPLTNLFIIKEIMSFIDCMSFDCWDMCCSTCETCDSSTVMLGLIGNISMVLLAVYLSSSSPTTSWSLDTQVAKESVYGRLKCG